MVKPKIVQVGRSVAHRTYLCMCFMGEIHCVVGKKSTVIDQEFASKQSHRLDLTLSVDRYI